MGVLKTRKVTIKVNVSYQVQIVVIAAEIEASLSPNNTVCDL